MLVSLEVGVPMNRVGLRRFLLLVTAGACSGCVTLLGTVHYPIFRESDSPAGKDAQYEVADLDFADAWVDGKPAAESKNAAIFEDGKAKANEHYHAAVEDKFPSSTSAPWVIKASVLQVSTDADTGFADMPHNGMNVRVSVVERSGGRVVERFLCEGAGGRTGYSYAVSAKAVGSCVATVLRNGSMKEGK